MKLCLAASVLCLLFLWHWDLVKYNFSSHCASFRTSWLFSLVLCVILFELTAFLCSNTSSGSQLFNTLLWNHLIQLHKFIRYIFCYVIAAANFNKCFPPYNAACHFSSLMWQSNHCLLLISKSKATYFKILLQQHSILDIKFCISQVFCLSKYSTVNCTKWYMCISNWYDEYNLVFRLPLVLKGKVIS